MTTLEILESYHAASVATGAAVDDLLELLIAEEDRTRDAERAAARAGAEAGRLRMEVRRLCARVAELEAELDVAPCDDCDGDCEECESA